MEAETSEHIPYPFPGDPGIDNYTGDEPTEEERREDEKAEINWGLYMLLKFGPNLPTLVPFHELRKRLEIEEPERLKRIVEGFKKDERWAAHLLNIFGKLEV